MKFLKDTIYNYASKLYIGLASVLLIPFFFRILGSDAYGIVGYFSVILIWLQILDMGLSNTLNRQTAIFSARGYSKESYLSVVNKVRFFYFLVAVLFLIIAAFNLDYIANEIIDSKIPKPDLYLYIYLMIFSISFRWLVMPFRSILIGFEKHKSIAKLDVMSETIKSPLCLLLVYIFPDKLLVFFICQTLSSLSLLISFYALSRRAIDNQESSSINVLSLKEFISFASRIFSVSFAWLVTSQSDKLFLSNQLSAQEYGLLTVLFQLASIIMFLSSPFSVALLPRLVRVAKEEGGEKLETFYRKSYKFSSLFLLIPVLIFFFFSKELIVLWTGVEGNIDNSVIVFRLYLLGNYIFALSSFSYYIQYAFGDISRHSKVSILASIVMLPIYYISSVFFGAFGTGIVWLFYNLIMLFIWGVYIHNTILSKNYTIEHYCFLFKILSIFLIGISLKTIFPSMEVVSYVLLSILYLSISIIFIIIFDRDFKQELFKLRSKL
ncbi:lipopolysaccharide biosynthesis protein [Vibrio fortis]|uniref:lipopolysaccharide biosynthesis protein n=1 Tax=Vibrio fortis TaxID=212667 RepID=UPI0038CD5A52